MNLTSIDGAMNIGIVGSRSFNDYGFLRKTMMSLYDVGSIDSIISGGANGADKLSERFSEEFGICMKIYIPEWERYGKSAGMIRNGYIVESSDEIVAFWDGKSTGTLNTIERARAANKIVHVVMTDHILSDAELSDIKKSIMERLKMRKNQSIAKK